jgi:predicted ATPase
LSVYLRHLAKKGDFIIIDEPELNLHPDNQRKIARFFGRMINEGFKLLISTHSDYIVRELNNLIMLKEGEKNKPSETENLLEKHNYNKSQLIDKQQVGVYLFRQGKEVESMEVNEMGFSVPTIDEEINRLNQTTNDIIFSIFD